MLILSSPSSSEQVRQAEHKYTAILQGVGWHTCFPGSSTLFLPCLLFEEQRVGLGKRISVLGQYIAIAEHAAGALPIIDTKCRTGNELIFHMQ